MFLKIFSLFFDHQNWQYFYSKILGFLEWETQIKAGSERVNHLGVSEILCSFKLVLEGKTDRYQSHQRGTGVIKIRVIRKFFSK